MLEPNHEIGLRDKTKLRGHGQSSQDGTLGEELEGKKVGSEHQGAGQAGSRWKSGNGAPSSVSNCQEEPLVPLWASANIYLLI